MKVVLASLLLLGAALMGSAAPLDEEFGYVEVRPGAHMFWVTYHVDQEGVWTDYPLIMWLQGGPGASGVGYGNFEELGPYRTDGSLRESAWTKKANVMFVDNPVGTGYSYVDSVDLYTRTNQEIADDLVSLVKSVFTEYPDMAAMPFYVMAESYGGKMTVDFALALDVAIKAGEVVSNFQGVGLGDSWISPIDSVNTWGPFLYSMGFVNKEAQAHIDQAAADCQAAVDNEQWLEATDLWGTCEGQVELWTNGVNFYNVLAEEDIYLGKKAGKHTKDLTHIRPEIRGLYERHVGSLMARDALGDLMNGEMADHWLIPDGVVWDSNGGTVFNILSEDFMKPVVDSVVNLLENTNIAVSVFTGDLDLICDTPGTYRWIENMNWSGKAAFDDTRRRNFNVPEYSTKAGYRQESGNFAVYTVLRSGHMIPIDAPSAALAVVDMITGTAMDVEKKTIENSKIVIEPKIEELHKKAEVKVTQKTREVMIEQPKKIEEIKKVVEQKTNIESGKEIEKQKETEKSIKVEQPKIVDKIEKDKTKNTQEHNKVHTAKEAPRIQIGQSIPPPELAKTSDSQETKQAPRIQIGQSIPPPELAKTSVSQETKQDPKIQIGQSIPPLGLAKISVSQEAKEAHSNLIGSRMSHVSPMGSKHGKTEPLARRMRAKQPRSFGI